MSARRVKAGLFAVAGAAVVCVLVFVAGLVRSKPLPYHFEGYEYPFTTRLAVLSITNRAFGSVEFEGPIEIVYADGWQPRHPCIVHSSLAINARASARWVFEVPPHQANWKVACVLQQHTSMEILARYLSPYRWLRWTAKLDRPRTITFSSDWITG
jgi:hypothetical protein